MLVLVSVAEYEVVDVSEALVLVSTEEVEEEVSILLVGE
jgi:hypothetical protein